MSKTTEQQQDDMFVHYASAALDMAGGEMDATAVVMSITRNGQVYVASSVRHTVNLEDLPRLKHAMCAELDRLAESNTTKN